MKINKWMTITIDGITFEKKIGEDKIFCEDYGVKIANSENANTFDEMVDIASNWLSWQT